MQTEFIKICFFQNKIRAQLTAHPQIFGDKSSRRRVDHKRYETSLSWLQGDETQQINPHYKDFHNYSREDTKAGKGAVIYSGNR